MENAQTQIALPPDLILSVEPPLPLSWQLTDSVSAAEWQSFKLPICGLTWLSMANLPLELSFHAFFNSHLAKNNRPTLVRGCLEPTALFLKSHGWGALQSGLEARLLTTLPHFAKKSLRDLVRRGLRHGQVVELSPDEFSLVDQFKNETVYARRPPLKRLFRASATQAERIFVLASSPDQWLAAITLSRHAPDGFHTELLLRRKGAPVGVMEALISGIFQTLKAESCAYLSLGEVPFYPAIKETTLKERSVRVIGQNIQFAYHSQGLLQFKMKFNPVCQPLYICARPNISWAALSELFIYSNCHRLVWQGLTRKLGL